MADAPVSAEHVNAVAEALESARVLYAFIGGVAVVAWGLPRQTFDLDVAVFLPESQLGKTLGVLTARGFVVDEVFARGFRDRIGPLEKIHAQLPAGRSLLTLDIFIATTPFVGSVLARRIAAEVYGRTVYVCSAADVILFKLLANRRKDVVDIENIITVQGIPERRHLEEWAEKLGVRERLDETLRQLGAS